ncbi:serine hydrolase [Zhouia amylolytica]|uniref:Beta-lactamase-related domain-containing protein n=1 Tax=Zhouia amylolytica AD3 TaxID=1286632 RepID=W2UQ44_9FLAO|nr:serine hydrolase [Zhouia amylolytica]ETN96255.1 hypothetical protein P278_07660 [Zhouia amylolytica AD3]
MKTQFLFYFFICTISNFLSAQDLPSDVYQEIERRIKLEINPSISIGILLPNGDTKYHSFSIEEGVINVKTDSLTLYEIGSITKTFTATLAQLSLKESMSVSIKDFFPDVDNSNLDRIELSELQNHIAGIPRLSAQFTPDDWSDPFNGYSDSLLNIELQSLKTDTLKVWRYSNLGYGILGKIVEKSTNRTFEDLMGGLLLKADMTNTYLNHQSAIINIIAQPTNMGTQNSYWNFTGPSRYAGGLISCTRDLIHYLKYQQKFNSLFTPNSINKLIPTGITDLGKDRLFYKDGWFVFNPEQHTQILFHNGGTGGYRSFLGFNKETKFGVVILTNSGNLVDDIGLKLLYPDFQLNHPERTIAYELADIIDQGNPKNLVATYKQLKAEEYPGNILNIYWLERFFFGKGKYAISHQLSNIMVMELPDDWEVFEINGQNLEKLERYEEAIIAYKKALKLNPGNTLLIDHIERCKTLGKS